MYDFYKGDTFSKEKPILASQSWKNRKSKGDHFFIYPYNNVSFVYNNFYL